MNMKRLIAVLALLATAVFAQWSLPPSSTYVPDSAVRAVRAGYLMNFSEDPLIDTGTVGWDSAAFKTWHATESLNVVTMKGTRGRFATLFGATLSGNFLGGGTDSIGNILVYQGTRGRFTNLFATDVQATWKTLDTTAVAVLARANVFTGVTQTISGAVPTWRLIQTNDTSKWWIDATDTVRHYSNKPVVWSGTYRRFLNTTVIDSSTGPVIQATRLRGNIIMPLGTTITNGHADTVTITETNIKLVGITLLGGKFKSGSVVFDSASHGVARDTLLFWAHDTAYAIIKRP
jgi:hypothetical protein